MGFNSTVSSIRVLGFWVLLEVASYQLMALVNGILYGVKKKKPIDINLKLEMQNKPQGIDYEVVFFFFFRWGGEAYV